MRKLFILLALSIPAWGQQVPPTSNYSVPTTASFSGYDPVVGGNTYLNVCIGAGQTSTGVKYTPGATIVVGQSTLWPTITTPQPCIKVARISGSQSSITTYGYVDGTSGALSVIAVAGPFSQSNFPPLACPIFSALVIDSFQINQNNGLVDRRPLLGCGGGGGGSGVGIFTVSTLPASPAAGTLATVKDGTSTSDCTAGGSTNTSTCIFTGSAWVTATSAAGSNSQVQTNSNGFLSGISSAGTGALVLANGTSQTKPTFDVRDSASSFDCTGTTAEDTGMQLISSTAHILIPAGCIVRLSSTHTYPQSFEFKQGGELKPDTGVLITMTGPIIAGSYQIFSNALATQGGIDFTGNGNSFPVLPEWWGAGNTVASATNTTAIQAAIYGAFGCNPSPVTSCRTNGSGLQVWNKELHFSTTYTINAALNMYHVMSFRITGAGRLFSGLVQGTANSKIINGQSVAFGAFEDLSFQTTASQDLSHALVDIDFDGSQGTDIKPQFVDFNRVLWNGNNTAMIGMIIAKSGGNAQGSNFNFYNNEAESFTEAAYMVGLGSGGTATNLATNAVSVMWHGGDCEGNPAYCIEAFGLSQGKTDTMTFEDGGSPSLGQTPQTGYDIFVTGAPSGATFEIVGVRSESIYLAGGNVPFVVRNSFVVDQAIVPSRRGTVFSTNDIIQGTSQGGHGVFFIVTAGGTMTILGSLASPRTASSGTATTIVDSVGGLTVNAWTGYEVTTLSGTGANQYCIITSNTATTFTCTAGWVTDFNTVTIANPDNTTTFVVEPNWGSQVTSGTVTWAAITKTDFSGHSSLDYVFIPGLQVNIGGTGVAHHFQTTRSDWQITSGSLVIDGSPNVLIDADDVIVGAPDNGAGSGEGALGAPLLQRNSKFARASVTEIPQFFQKLMGSKSLHWATGLVGGGFSVSDVYAGVQGTTSGQGQFFINNHSSGSSQQWLFNFDGTSTFPGTPTAPLFISNGTTTGMTCSSFTNGLKLSSGTNTGLGTFGANTIDMCANNVRAMQFASTAVNVEGSVNLAFSGGKGQHFNTQAAQSDMAGTCTMTSGTCTAITFTTAYTSAPACTVSWTGSGTLTGILSTAATTTQIKPTSSVNTDTAVVTYICVGNPN